MKFKTNIALTFLVFILFCKQSIAVNCRIDTVVYYRFNSSTTKDTNARYIYTYNSTGNKTQELYQIRRKGTYVWENSFKTDYTFDANGNKTQEVFQQWKTGSSVWENSSMSDFTYNATNKVLQQTNLNWSSSTSAWIGLQRYSYTYDMADRITQFLTETWSSGTSAWVNINKYAYTYDGSGNLIVFINQNWDAFSSTWVNADKISDTWNSSNKLTQQLVQRWRVATSTWVDSFQNNYTYDASVRIIQNIYQKWSKTASALVNVSKLDLTFDGSGYNTRQIFQNWNTSTSAWNNSVKDSFIYNGSGKRAQFIHHNWDKNTSNWYTSYRYDYTYVSGNLTELLYQVWNGSGWSDYSRLLLTRNAAGQITQKLDQDWSTFASAWVNTERNDSTYDANGCLQFTDHYYNWDNATSTWDAHSQDEFFTFATGVGLVRIETAPMLQGYPNPAFTHYTVLLNPAFNGSSLSVYNSMGQKINELSIDQSLTEFHIDISDYPAGLYIIKCGDAQTKLLKE